jgi:S-adenosylmethionine hydrolase
MSLHRRKGLVGVAALLALSAFWRGQHQLPVVEAASARRTIVFMTDFGTANDSVAICKAVIAGIAPDAFIADLTHQVTHYQIEEGARFLAAVTPYYPADTIFLGVVDPGVGTARRAIIAKSKKGQYFVVPDNGLVTPVMDRDGLDSAHEIANPDWMLPGISHTFHGRDVFSPTAAHLAAGWDFNLAGPVLPELVRLPLKNFTTTPEGIRGEIIGLDDPYGSLITDIPAEEFKKLGYSIGDEVAVRLDNKPMTLPYMNTFMDVPIGDTLLYIDSRGRLGLAINQGNYAEKFNIRPPGTIFVPRKAAVKSKP